MIGRRESVLIKLSRKLSFPDFSCGNQYGALGRASLVQEGPKFRVALPDEGHALQV